MFVLAYSLPWLWNTQCKALPQLAKWQFGNSAWVAPSSLYSLQLTTTGLQLATDSVLLTGLRAITAYNLQVVQVWSLMQDDGFRGNGVPSAAEYFKGYIFQLEELEVVLAT